MCYSYKKAKSNNSGIVGDSHFLVYNVFTISTTFQWKYMIVLVLVQDMNTGLIFPILFFSLFYNTYINL